MLDDTQRINKIREELDIVCKDIEKIAYAYSDPGHGNFGLSEVRERMGEFLKLLYEIVY